MRMPRATPYAISLLTLIWRHYNCKVQRFLKFLQQPMKVEVRSHFTLHLIINMIMRISKSLQHVHKALSNKRNLLHHLPFQHVLCLWYAWKISNVTMVKRWQVTLGIMLLTLHFMDVLRLATPKETWDKFNRKITGATWGFSRIYFAQVPIGILNDLCWIPVDVGSIEYHVATYCLAFPECNVEALMVLCWDRGNS